MSIPFDPANSDYAAYLDWVDRGNTPASPVEVEPPVPRIVTMRQARLALLAAGKLPGVAAAISSLDSPHREAAQIEWEYAATVDRDAQLMALVAAALQLDDAALDELFSSAAGL